MSPPVLRPVESEHVPFFPPNNLTHLVPFTVARPTCILCVQVHRLTLSNISMENICLASLQITSKTRTHN